MLHRCMSGSTRPRLLAICILSLLVSSWAQDVDECNIPQRASGTSGLLSRVVDLKGTIGYAGLDSVLRAKSEEGELDSCVLHVAQMKNKWGQVVAPNANGAQAAVRSRAAAFEDSSCPGFGLCTEVHDGEDADVWPLSTLTYLVVPTNTADEEDGCDNMKTVHDYAKWILTDVTAADIAKELSMATMPNIIAEQALEILDEMQCVDADGVARLVRDRPTRAEMLQGGGSSLQGNLQTKLTNAFFQQSFVSIAYTASSSVHGRAALRNFEVQFAGSESGLDMSDPEFIRRGVKMIPVFVAAVALVHNLDGADNLVLTREAVAGLFTGSITSWANPAIRSHNPDTFLANDAVVRVVREFQSGTTSALTKAIYSFTNLPTGTQLDYSMHPLGGSDLPDWPIPALPYADGAVCNLRHCITEVCEPGQRLDIAAETCVPCPKGFFSGHRGQHTECDACSAGSYTNSEGNSKCAKCDEFQYQDLEGQRACKQCPANSRRFFKDVDVGGAIVQEETPGESVEECMCVAGFWLPASVNQSSLGGLPCEPCPAGATCAGFVSNRQQIPAPKKHYWGDPLNPCGPAWTKSCQGSYRCEEGHTGRLCSEPEQGYFSVGRLWTPRCPSGSGAGSALVVCTLVVVVAFWFKLRTLCNSNLDSFAVVVGIVQVFHVISRMRLRWHPSIEAATAVLAVLNYDVGFFGWHCAMPSWDGVSAYFVQLWLPFILTALAAAIYLVRWYFEMRGSSHSRDKNVRAKGVLRSPKYLPDSMATYLQGRFLSFVLMMYHTLVIYALAPFVCDTEPDGQTQYVSLMPDVRCNSAGHKMMRICSILYTLLLLIPVPIYLANRMWRALKKDVLNMYDFMEHFGFMYLKFHIHVPWWELTLVARKGLLGLVLVAVSVPMIQAVLAILIINVGMCLQLVYKPMVDANAHQVEVAGLFASLAMALCGMLFFPSLDKSVECVGAANLVSLIGDQCASNQQVKARVAVPLLLMLAVLGALAVLLSAKEVHARWLAEKTALHMKVMIQRQKARMLGRAVERQESWNPVWDTPTCWHGLAYRLGLRQEAPTTQKHSIVDPYTLKLCHMIQGYHLHWWEQSIQALEQDGQSRWQRVREHVRLHREELAYIETDETLSKFATIFDHVSGFYVNDDFANKLRQIASALSLLVDWLASADAALRRDFCAALESLTVYCRKHHSQAYNEVVVTEYQAPVVHWLMRCTEEQRRSFRVVFTAIASASGLGTGKLVNLGLGNAMCADGLEGGREAMPVGLSFKGSSPSGSPDSDSLLPASSALPHAAANPTTCSGAVGSEPEHAAESPLLLPPPSEAGWAPLSESATLAPDLEPPPPELEGATHHRCSVILHDGTEITEIHDAHHGPASPARA